jgi:hypothetical protein
VRLYSLIRSEILILFRLDVGEAAFSKLGLENGKVDQTHKTSKKQTQLDPAVVNLLLSFIYAETARTRSTVLLPGCPVLEADTVKSYLNQLMPFTNVKVLTAALKPPRSEPEELLSWICSTYGNDIVPASGNLFIASMPKTVHQFVLVKPTPVLQTRFDAALAKRSTSCVLYHGTPLKHLHSIMCNGFWPAADRRFGKGVFMAENPETSYYYAGKDQYDEWEDDLWVTDPKWENDSEQGNDSEWRYSPFQSFGVLLGCGVAGHGRLVEDDEPDVHVIKHLSSVMIRYIFLLSPEDLNMDGRRLPPKGSVLRPEMLAGFAAIRAM